MEDYLEQWVKQVTGEVDTRNLSVLANKLMQIPPCTQAVNSKDIPPLG